jgi:ankyrin repeat protein
MVKIPLDEALTDLCERDPGFKQEIRNILAPVKDRFFSPPIPGPSDNPDDGLITPPPYLMEPDLRTVAFELAQLALDRGIDVNLACNPDGSTFLHEYARLRDPQIAIDAVGWCLAHGADPNRPRDNGDTPLDVAERFGRTEVAELMRTHGGR